MGKGSFGEVMKARNKNNNKNVAIKLMQNIFGDEYKSRKLVGEI
jgi:serine/threonine protein kinase